MIQAGDRVKLSDYALESARVWWLSVGDYPRKQAARRYLDSQLARRGTVAGVKDNAVTVVWDDGTTSHSLDYRLEHVDA